MAKRGKFVKRTKDSVVYQRKDGTTYARLTPTGKCKRYDRELRAGRNSRTGEPLNDAAAGYRMGYRAALGEQAAIYRARNK